ncbi:MAG: SPFH domain-containing protein [Steroidobacteraceae bacterium]
MNSSHGSTDIEYRSTSGYAAVAAAVVGVLWQLACFSGVIDGIHISNPVVALISAVVAAVITFAVAGIYMLQPNQAALLMLFGSYRGTDYGTGLRWANPLMTKKKLSMRLRNFNSERLKVNDKRGNPIEIGAAIVWRVSDAARALLDVDNFEAYVPVQAEAAIRHLASEFAYDAGEEDQKELSLRGGGEVIIARLKQELAARFDKAGLEVEDARLTHLAYAPEIAGAMLRRQQAEAVIAARKHIVLGAVSMVEMALAGLRERDIIELDDERRAAMVCNLLVVLCGESDAQPVINAGSLYQ